MKRILHVFVLVAAGLATSCLIGCAGMSTKNGSITSSAFGKLPDGRAVELYTLRNSSAEVHITAFGGIVTSFKVPDKNGNAGDVVLGYDTLEDYLKSNPYF